MACASCGSNRTVYNTANVSFTPTMSDEVVPKSDDPNKKIRIRYYGSGTKSKSSGCKTCGGGKGYSVTTSETIMFVSEDSPNNLFKETFTIGHDYYVTTNQADFLCDMTYRNKVGQIAHKFKRVEER